MRSSADENLTEERTLFAGTVFNSWNWIFSKTEAVHSKNVLCLLGINCEPSVIDTGARDKAVWRQNPCSPCTF